MEFWKKNRRKLALEPKFVSASLKSALLKLPFEASAGLSRESRNHVTPNCETSVGWLKSGISSLRIFKLETPTRRNA